MAALIFSAGFAKAELVYRDGLEMRIGDATLPGEYDFDENGIYDIHVVWEAMMDFSHSSEMSVYLTVYCGSGLRLLTQPKVSFMLDAGDEIGKDWAATGRLPAISFSPAGVEELGTAFRNLDVGWVGLEMKKGSETYYGALMIDLVWGTGIWSDSDYIKNVLVLGGVFESVPGKSVLMSDVLAIVPEPGTLGLAGGGLLMAGLLWARRRAMAA